MPQPLDPVLPPGQGFPRHDLQEELLVAQALGDRLARHLRIALPYLGQAELMEVAGKLRSALHHAASTVESSVSYAPRSMGATVTAVAGTRGASGNSRGRTAVTPIGASLASKVRRASSTPCSLSLAASHSSFRYSRSAFSGACTRSVSYA